MKYDMTVNIWINTSCTLEPGESSAILPCKIAEESENESIDTYVTRPALLTLPGP